MEENKDRTVEKIVLKLSRCAFAPVDTLQHGGTKLFMERIEGTSKFLSNMKKVIYDVAFADLYYHDRKIPSGHFAIGEHLYRIEACANIQDAPDVFLDILSRKVEPKIGTKFYLDNILYAENVPFSKDDSIRDNLLQQRKEGTLSFRSLKIIDPSGAVTEFLPSPAVEKRMRGQNGN